MELMARGQELDYEDAKSVGQVVKEDEEFALRRFQDSVDRTGSVFSC